MDNISVKKASLRYLKVYIEGGTSYEICKGATIDGYTLIRSEDAKAFADAEERVKAAMTHGTPLEIVPGPYSKKKIIIPGSRIIGASIGVRAWDAYKGYVVEVD